MSPDELDLYLERIGLGHRPVVDFKGLAQIQRAQRLSVPFENLDIPLGRGISLDPDMVFEKLVRRKRGGYCFEQNQLFGRALAALGFATRLLLGRVWLFADGNVPPRTHTLNLVTLDGADWIADAGFGAGYAPPMRLRDGAEVTGEDGATHRLRSDPDHGWMLERQTSQGLVPQYSFTLASVAPVDLDMSNHWTSSWPGSRFTKNVIASIVLPHGLAALTNRQYSRTSRAGSETGEITSPRMMQMRLSLVFGITLTMDEVASLDLWDDQI